MARVIKTIAKMLRLRGVEVLVKKLSISTNRYEISQEFETTSIKAIVEAGANKNSTYNKTAKLDHDSSFIVKDKYELGDIIEYKNISYKLIGELDFTNKSDFYVYAGVLNDRRV